MIIQNLFLSSNEIFLRIDNFFFATGLGLYTSAIKFCKSPVCNDLTPPKIPILVLDF